MTVEYSCFTVRLMLRHYGTLKTLLRALTLTPLVNRESKGKNTRGAQL